MSRAEVERIDDVVDAELIPADAHDEAVTAILDTLDQVAKEDLWEKKAGKTKTGYARDWELWEEFHDWLAEQTGKRLPSSAITFGTMCTFVKWLDEVKEAAPNGINRRISGVTVMGRRYGYTVPPEAGAAAREMVKTLALDEDRMARGRGRAVAASPANVRAMNKRPLTVPRKPGSSRRRREYTVPELARLRDRAMTTMSFGIAGRAAEVAKLRAEKINLVDKGLEVHVPSVKGRKARDVVIPYGEHPDSCAVRCWLAWQAASGITEGAAFRSVDQWGHMGEGEMSPDAVRLAITRGAERAGVAAKLTGHSMRSGFITAARRSGKRREKIREVSGHAEGPVFDGYIRDADKWTDAAGEGIGM